MEPNSCHLGEFLSHRVKKYCLDNIRNSPSILNPFLKTIKLLYNIKY